MRDEQGDVGWLQAGALDGCPGGRCQRAGRESVGLLALHPDVVLAAGDRLGRGWTFRPAGRQPDHVGTLRLGRQLDPKRATRLVRCREDDRACAIAEQDAGVPVAVIEEAGEQLRPDDQHVPGHPARDVCVRGGVGVHEPGTRGRHVHGRRPRVPDRFLDQRRGRRHPVVRREGGEQDEIDLVRVDAGGPDGAHGGHRRHGGRRLMGRRDASFPDARTRHDPFVGRIDHLRQVVVGQDV